MPSQKQCNVMIFDKKFFVISVGIGGLDAAKRAAEDGVHVAIAQQEQVSDTCFVQGCIPEKLITYAASFSHIFQWANEYSLFRWDEIRSDLSPNLSSTRRERREALIFSPLPAVRAAKKAIANRNALANVGNRNDRRSYVRMRSGGLDYSERRRRVFHPALKNNSRTPVQCEDF
ncbi:hypothetical protein [Allocoleopsis sp.]|uniref:hypothetical protein n=1 Tax=Allocoleopsis sp. TaxID=3088169 RepID=UPI002FCE88DF